MKIIGYLLPLSMMLISFVSCDERKFNSNQWITDAPAGYKERNGMVEDLISSGILLHKGQLEIHKLLGIPNYIDSTMTGKIISIGYTTNLSYGFDIDPKFVSDLVIEFDTLTNKTVNVKIESSVDKRSWIEKILTE